MKKRITNLFKRRKTSKSNLEVVEKRLKDMGRKVRRRVPKDVARKMTPGELIRHSKAIRVGLVVLAIFLLAEITTQGLGLWLKPVYTPKSDTAQRRRAFAPRKSEDVNPIRNRNIFDSQGVIPPIFDPGDYGCFSEARPSSARVQLLATIVMKRQELSVALLDDGSGKPVAVRPGEPFSRGQYTAIEVRRKQLCFQTGAAKEFEYITIKDDAPGLRSGGPALTRGSKTNGITIKGEAEVEVAKSFLEDKLKNLNEILQTARAVPNMEGGAFNGFLIQSIQQDSLFYELGIRQGDVLTTVNDTVLDNAGKGLEAFQTLRNSDQITLQIVRNGQPKTLNFSIR